eukprot:CAMPEP_0175848894 /NCGR_PEP_ID=MMETSP0107_2-20121207/24190_1 /TAXON_ID=195067 ORGANISM="Goniomonas pacifica, Strain CCMP1869" /NCGR_SAMPLE_ID=MMETSP0107_2 /ASSEMBLY_ACC=CAM_ASM_000203 /LENGTH=60 /DNA_ID=CAMNT_0017163927 /DNA_START=70 /DNA_END=249 /DNA_ORIENTATION=-
MAVLPSLSLALTSAPAVMRTCATSPCPFMAALCSGVSPCHHVGGGGRGPATLRTNGPAPD